MSKRKKSTLAILLWIPATLVACDASPTAPFHESGDYTERVIPDGDPIPFPIETPWVFENGGPGAPAIRPQERPGPDAGSDWSRADVVAFAEPAAVVGESWMRRGAGQVSVRLSAGQLPPGHAATLWAVVFNEPSACVGECDDPDLFENPAAQADLLYVAGAVSNRLGELSYTARVREGDAGASIMPLFGLAAPGVIDAERAEIHLVVRSHGPVLDGLRREQTTTFNGGCTGFGSEFGTPGTNECVDLYYASHYAN